MTSAFTLVTPGPHTPPTQVEDTEFSIDRGVFSSDEAFEVEISTATADALISFTLDGSDPADSGTMACTGRAPLQVTIDPTAGSHACGDGSQITRTPAPGVILRAYAHKVGETPSNTDTQSYIFITEVLRQAESYPDWPEYDYSGNGGPAHHDYAMDPAIVEDPKYRDDLIDGLLDLPTMSLAAPRDPFWQQVYRGDGEISASIEIIYPDGHSEQADAGLQRHSHDRTKNSLRLSFRDEFGSKKLHTQLFKRARLHGAAAVEEIDRVVLRAGNNRSWARSWNPDRTTYTTDQWFRDTQLALTGVGARGNFVHLYIDGLYWGLYNPTERPDEWFTSAHQGGEPEHWFAISHGGPKDGDPSRYDELFDEIIRSDLKQLDNFETLLKYLDLDNFCDYLLLHWYAGVMDWPSNNWWAGMRTLPEGPLQYFAWDGEWSFATKGAGSPDRPEVHPDFRAQKAKGSGSASARLFNGIKESPEFMLHLADRSYRALALDGALSDDAARERWAILNEVVFDAVVAESARWGDAVTRNGEATRMRDEDWQNEAAFTDAYMQGAARDLLEHMRGQGYYPSIDPPGLSYAGVAVETRRLIVDALPVEIQFVGDGPLFYTLDGSDPRAKGGEAQGMQAQADERVVIKDEAQLIVRQRSGDEWSARRVLDLVYCAGGDCSCSDPEVVCNGECVDIDQSLEHCGGCERRCELAHAKEQCSAGRCEIDSCEPGFDDIDGQPGNGCEHAVGMDEGDEAGDEATPSGDDDSDDGTKSTQSVNDESSSLDDGDSGHDEGTQTPTDEDAGCKLAAKPTRLVGRLGWLWWPMTRQMNREPTRGP